MMPNLGQGGCQAFEDGYVLSDLLCKVSDKKQIPDVLQEYYRKRLFRSAIVQGLSRLSSDVIISSFSTPFRFDEFLKEGLKYKYLTVPSVITSIMQAFLPAIFYSEFGYLYSFAPAQFTKEQVSGFVNNSMSRNEKEAEVVYKHLKDGFQTYFTAKTMQFMRYDKNKKEATLITDVHDIRRRARAGSK
jgi:zeaxanthin epoxidase